jgi:hypothetical protein
MSVIALGIILFLILWGFMPLRAFFPYLLMPLLMLGIVAFFLGVSSPMTGF